MRIIVLFNLKPGTDVAAYETWARKRDLPSMRSLPSVSDFQIYRGARLLGSDGKPRYEYIEVIDILDLETYGRDAGSEAAKRIAAQFEEFADDPQFIVTKALSEINL